MTASTAAPSIPPAAKAELTPTGKLRAGINFQNVLLTTLGPNGEQGGVAVEFAPTLPGSRILEGNFTVVRHTVGTPRGRDAAAAYLRDLVEDVKASGLVAKWIEKSGVKGLSAAPAAGK